MGVKMAVQTVFTALNKMSGPMATMSRGVSKFAAGASRASSMARSGFSGLRSMIGTVAMALTTGAAMKALSDFASRGDDIADVAKRIGLSASALQEFQYAAKLSDLTAEDFTGLLQKMNNNMGQLGASTGSLYTYLKRTNPQLALQLKNTKDSEKAFTLLMDSIAAETDVTKRAALAQAAFGRSGQEVIDMAGDLNAKRREARESGTLISDADVGTAAKLHGTLLRIKASGMGILNTVLGQLATRLGPIIEGVHEWIKANKGFIEQNVGIVFKVISDVFQQLGPALAGVIAKLLPAIQRLIEKALPVLVELLEILLPILDPLLELLDPILDIFLAIAPAIKAVAETIKAVLVPVLQILKPILELIAILLKPVVDAIAWVSNLEGKLLGGALGKIAGLFTPQKGGAGQSALGPISPNTGVIASNVTTTRNSTLDVNFNRVPAGTEMRQRGVAPGISVNMGQTLALGGLSH